MARLTDRARNDLKCVEGPKNKNQTKTKRGEELRKSIQVKGRG